MHGKALASAQVYFFGEATYIPYFVTEERSACPACSCLIIKIVMPIITRAIFTALCSLAVVTAMAQRELFSSRVDGLVLGVAHDDTGYYTFSLAYPQDLNNQVCRLDKKGTKVWQNTFGAADDAFLMPRSRIIPTRSGFLCIMNGINKISLVNIDRNGKPSWSKQLGTIAYMEGSMFSEPDQSIRIVRTDEQRKVLFEHLDSMGNTLSSAVVSHFHAVGVYDLVKTASGSYVFGMIDTALYTDGHSKIWLACTDANGSLLWSRLMNEPESAEPYMDAIVAMDDDIGVFMNMQSRVPHKTALLAYKLSTDGSLLAREKLVDNESFFYYDTKAIPASDGWYYFVNHGTDSMRFTTSELVKLDKNMKKQWSYAFDLPVYTITNGGCNTVITSFWSEAGRGSAITESYSIVKSILDPQREDICNKCQATILPNPAAGDSFSVRSDHPGDVLVDKLDLYDYTGNKVWDTDPADDSMVSVQHRLSDGIYICRIGCDNGKEQLKRVVISR